MSSVVRRDDPRSPRPNRANPRRVGAPTRPPQRRTRPSPTPEQTRALLGIAARPGLLALVIIATCVLVVLVAANSDLTGTSGAVAAGWLAVHQVPLTIGGASLSMLPLLPTLLMVAAVARGCARVVSASTPRHEVGWVFAAALAGPVLITAIALAVAADASSVIALSMPNPLAAFAWVIAVHAVGAGIGIGMRLWGPVVTRFAIPDWALAALRPAARAAMALLATGAAVTVVSLIASWSTVGMLVEAGDGFMGGLGLTVLSILYLPNVIVGATAVLVGSVVHVGDASVSLFDVIGGRVPALPVLGALPEHAGGDGWLVGLVVPAAVGVMFGRECARRAPSPVVAAQTALVGAAVVATGFAVLGFVSGGSIGSFGTAGVAVLTFAAATLGWLAVFGSVTAAITRWRAKPEPVAVAPAAETAGQVPVPTALAAGAGGASASAIIDAEVLDDAPLDEAPLEIAEVVEDQSIVDVEVVPADGDGVAQVTDPEVESDLPEGGRTSSD